MAASSSASDSKERNVLWRLCHASVSARLLFVLLPLVFLLVAGTAWLAVVGSERIADRNATRYGHDLAESQVAVIALPVRTMKVAVDNLALAVSAYAVSGGRDRRFVADLVRMPMAGQADYITGLWFYAVPDVFGRDADYRGRDVALGDAKSGRMLTYYARVGEQADFEAAIDDFESQDWWRVPRETGQPYSGSPYLYPVFGRDHLVASYAVPVMAGGRFVGIVGADMDVTKAAGFLETLRPAGGRLLSVNREGIWINNPYASLSGQPVRVGGDWRVEMPAWELEHVKALQSFVSDKTGPHGERVRRIAVPAPFFDGEQRRMLMVDFPLDTLLEPYRDVRIAILLAGLFAAMGIGIAVLVLVPALIGNPLQTLRRNIEELNAGHLAKPVKGMERGDEVGAIARALDSFRATLIDQRRLTREKAELLGQLFQQQKMDAIGQLAGGIAHDFNNLLGVILGYLGFIASDSPAGSSQRGYAEQATRAGNRAKDLIRQLLSFARPSVGARVDISAEGVMQESAALLRGSLPASIELAVETEPGLPAIRADQTQMIQVLMNLAINAADACGGPINRGGSGRIALRAAHAPLPEWQEETLDWPSFLALAPAAAGETVTFEIFDTAGGIAAENLPRMFEPFYTTKAANKGTGMGLAIVYGVLQAHGGGLEVRSKRGVGTLFRLAVPAGSGKPGEIAASEPPRKAKPCRIIIVDDEQDMADMLEEGLSRFGHEVAVCEDADEALAVFEENPEAFDVVLTDQTMPGMSGVELIRRLKRRRPDLPCILYTGYSDSSDGAVLRSTGADALLFKPVLPATIDAHIAEHLGSR